MMMQSKKPALLCIFLALFLATTTFADATASAEYLHGMVLLQSFDDGVVIGVDRGDVEIRDGIVDDIFVFQVEYGEVPDLYFLETAQVEYFHNSLNVYSLSDDRTIQFVLSGYRPARLEGEGNVETAKGYGLIRLARDFSELTLFDVVDFIAPRYAPAGPELKFAEEHQVPVDGSGGGVCAKSCSIDCGNGNRCSTSCGQGYQASCGCSTGGSSCRCIAC